LLTTSALGLLAAALLSAPAAAQSACVPSSPSDGDTVVCSGTGSGIVDDGLDDATITVQEGALVEGGANQGFEFDDDVSFTNEGTVTSTGEHAVQGDNGVVVVNNGTITGGGGDGVNIDNDGRIENSGTITGDDDGVQVESDGTVINTATGIITATDEGINANQPNAVIENHGIVEAGDDAINAGTNATITNTGRITSTGDQDGIDLDDGTIVNSGLIESRGAEDGIDFDPSAEASTVTNTGTIQGTIAINTDPADTGAQTIVNSGRLTGFGGTALSLGAGDDVVILDEGSVVQGAIEMGDGNDTLRINYVALERLPIGSVIETVTTAGPSIVGTSAIVLLDPERLGREDRDSQTLAYDLSRRVLTVPGGAGFWAAGRGVAVDGDDRSFLGGVIGYDFALGGHTLGAYVGLANANDLDATVAGLRFDLGVDGPFDLQATAFVGKTDGADIAGSGGAEGTIAGAAARATLAVLQAAPGGFGLDMALEGGFSGHFVDGYTLGDLDTGIADRDTTSGYARFEIGVPFSIDSETTLRGFAAVTHHTGSADPILASFEGVDTSFASGADLDRTAFGVGASFTKRLASGVAFDARVEASHADDDTDVAFGLAVRVPLGR
jgi:hypothetical protein